MDFILAPMEHGANTRRRHFQERNHHPSLLSAMVKSLHKALCLLIVFASNVISAKSDTKKDEWKVGEKIFPLLRPESVVAQAVQVPLADAFGLTHAASRNLLVDNLELVWLIRVFPNLILFRKQELSKVMVRRRCSASQCHCIVLFGISK